MNEGGLSATLLLLLTAIICYANSFFAVFLFYSCVRETTRNLQNELYRTMQHTFDYLTAVCFAISSFSHIENFLYRLFNRSLPSRDSSFGSELEMGRDEKHYGNRNDRALSPLTPSVLMLAYAFYVTLVAHLSKRRQDVSVFSNAVPRALRSANISVWVVASVGSEHGAGVPRTGRSAAR